ncbi:hypothetical protein JIN84_05770 [Luteolibacter yonseiensis]|uniref:Uncharacterized protein n=1 Tax=Luteolibacter yonseiensis TaxID=1144680 RepID=A0A934VB74_9BACT|nr:hypothetical protein [Luteolibacter yonseiensis]MBK1815109.1 hypothetical protein [Luteolibacter yonseiensis]
MKKTLKSLITCISLVFIAGSIPVVLAEKEADIKQKIKYAGIENPKERLYFCIEVLSDGTVKRGMILPQLQEIFDKKIEEIGDLEDGGKLYNLDFEKAPDLSKEYGLEYPSPFIGWYLRMEMDKYGKLERYHLSNLHK